MNILIFEYEHMAIEDLCEALTNLGHTYTVITDEQIYDRANNAFAARFDKHIESASYDAVFTFNYFPIISNCCKKHNIPYIAFVYDSPLLLFLLPGTRWIFTRAIFLLSVLCIMKSTTCLTAWSIYLITQKAIYRGLCRRR